MATNGAPHKGNNTLYASIGNAAKSGDFIAYQYRMVANLPADDFLSGEDEASLDLSKIQNVVLVDDMIGSGRTVAKEVAAVAEEVYSLVRTRNLFVLAVAGYEAGIAHIVDETGAKVVCALEYSAEDTVASLDGSFYRDMSVAEREAAQATIRKYGQSVSGSSGAGLGFGKVGGLLVFEHNTPNTTLPIIWQDNRDWMGLFPRAKSVPRAAKVLKAAQKEREKTKGKASSHDPAKVELTAFVEGRLDELIVEHLCRSYDLAARVGVKAIDPVALGGLYQSQRLFGLVQDSRKHAVFILEDDRHTRRVAETTLKGVTVLLLSPSFVSLLDFDKIYDHADRFGELPPRDHSKEDERWYIRLEKRVFRGRSRSRPESIATILDEYLDEKAYSAFATQLREKVSKMLEAAPATE